MATHRRAASASFLAGLLATAAALWSSPLHAQSQNLEGLAPGSIVRIVMASGNVNVRAWDRQAVGIDDPSGVNVRRFTVEASAAQSTLPILAGKIGGPLGGVELPEESFAVSTLAPGSHDVVAVRGRDANVTVNVPRNASLVTVQMGKGNVALQDYRDGTFIARVRNGSAHLSNVGGDGYVQVLRGPIAVDQSSFQRVRVRSGTGDVTFQNCRAKQIEVTSVRGSIVYDGGSFEPGLARFETQSGNVALGVSGRAELAAHASSGHVFTALDSGSHVSGRDGERLAVLGGGGPLINATSGSGNVYLYSGQLSAHRTSGDWQPVRSMLGITGRAPSSDRPVTEARSAPHVAKVAQPQTRRQTATRQRAIVRTRPAARIARPLERPHPHGAGRAFAPAPRPRAAAPLIPRTVRAPVEKPVTRPAVVKMRRADLGMPPARLERRAERRMHVTHR